LQSHEAEGHALHDRPLAYISHKDLQRALTRAAKASIEDIARSRAIHDLDRRLAASNDDLNNKWGGHYSHGLRGVQFFVTQCM
jgi:hypothetical protein